MQRHLVTGPPGGLASLLGREDARPSVPLVGRLLGQSRPSPADSPGGSVWLETAGAGKRRSVYHFAAMRTFILIVVLFALAASASAGTRQPSLRLVDDSPLTIQGARFGNSQSVRITVSRAGEIVARRTVRSGSGGGFVARFSRVSLHRCDGGGTIVARSATGRFAVAKVPQVECPMPLDPP